MRSLPEQDAHEERVFSNYVAAHLKNFAKAIDVTDFMNSNGWDFQKILDLYDEILWNNPDIFYVARKIQVQGKQYTDGTVRDAELVNIRYAIKPEEYQLSKQLLDAEVKKAVCYAAVESAPERIALRLHDYIVRICEYDVPSADNNDHSPLARTVYSVLVRKKAVCEGYTMAYRYLLQKFNIRSEEIISLPMEHCWNYVNIRDKWYHVDVTFDDPVFADGTGGALTEGIYRFLGCTQEISHRYFMMSDEKARRGKHHDWLLKGLPPADDRSFDNYIW